MKLYTFDPAPNPRRVALMLKYKGVELASEQISLMEGAQFSEAFKEVNPRCTVPVLLLDDGQRLCDVIAICSYLDHQYREKTVFGNDALERAQILGYCHRFFLEGFSAVAEVLRNGNDNFKGRALPGTLKLEQIPALAERGSKRLTAFFEDMNAELENRRFLVGDQLSQADIDLLVAVEFSGWVSQPPSTDHLALQRHIELVRQTLGE
jgi:glutathione S-transferase